MKKESIDELINLTVALEAELKHFNEITNRLMGAETENADEIDALIAQRQERIEKMKLTKSAMNKLIDEQEPTLSKSLKKLYTGDFSHMHISDELKPLQSAVVSLRSVHALSLEKEKQLGIQFNSRYNDIRENLAKLQEDKKKINFYSNIETKKGIGQALDSRS